MSDGTRPIYCVDTNSLMDWQARYYPTDIFTGVLSRMDQLAIDGRLIAPALVHEEVDAVGTPELVAWAKAHKGIFVPNADVLKKALAIQHRFPAARSESRVRGSRRLLDRTGPEDPERHCGDARDARRREEQTETHTLHP